MEMKNNLAALSIIHFSKLSLVFHWFVHSVAATRYFCILLTYTSLLMTDNNFESSAKSFISHKVVSGRSLMYTKKKSSPSTELCGTPLSKSDHSGIFSPTTILCLRLLKKSSNQLKISRKTPYSASWCNNL